MELTQERDELVLGRGLFPQTGIADLPDLIDGAPAVHEADQQVRRGGDALVAV